MTDTPQIIDEKYTDDEGEFDMTMTYLKLELAIRKHIDHMGHVAAKHLTEENTRVMGRMLSNAEDERWVQTWGQGIKSRVYSITL